MIRTLNHGFSSFHQVDHIHTSVCMVQYGTRKPMSSGFYELKFMKAGPLLYPPLSFSYLFKSVDQVFFRPGYSAIPLDNFLSMHDIDRSGFPIETKPIPIPQ